MRIIFRIGSLEALAMDNRRIARELAHRARYLADSKCSLYRVRAYRRAAETVLGLDEPVEAIVARSGLQGLQTLPGIGDHLSKAIEALVRTGQLPNVTEPSRGMSAANPAGPTPDTPCPACGPFSN